LENPTHKITVVGGGAIGASIAIQILQGAARTFPDYPDKKISIDIIDPANTLGHGIPYARVGDDNIATLNQPSSRMNFDGSDPNGFCNHLNPQDPDSIKNQFSRRAAYGVYVNDSLNTAIAQAEQTGAISFNHIRARATDIFPVSMGGFRINTDQTDTLQSSHVIVADGHQYSDSLPHLTNSPNFFNRYHQIAAVTESLRGSDQDIAIRGTSQSMVDWLRVLEHIGHTGKIYAVSRHGYMPWEFNPEDHPLESDDVALDLKFINQHVILSKPDISVNALIDLFENDVESARHTNHGRGHVLTHSIKTLAPLLRDPRAEKTAIRPFFDFLAAAYGNPTPPESAALIRRLREEGRLIHLKGSIDETTTTASRAGFRISLGNGHDTLGVSALFDSAVFARTALDRNGRARSPLLDGLHKQELLNVDGDMFVAGEQKQAGLYLGKGPQTSELKWGIESFRGENSRICKVVVDEIFFRPAHT
jgi:hypothetical protein